MYLKYKIYKFQRSFFMAQTWRYPTSPGGGGEGSPNLMAIYEGAHNGRPSLPLTRKSQVRLRFIPYLGSEPSPLAW